MRRLISPQRDLGIQLLALYLLLVIPVLTAVFIFDSLAGNRIRSEVTTSDLSLARAIAKETDVTMQNTLDAVAELGKYPAVINADPAGMETVFSIVNTTRPDVNLVYRLDAQGVMLYHHPVGPGSTVGTDFSFRDYFIRAQAGNAPLLSEGRISPTTEQPVATAVTPLRDTDGEFIGLAGMNIRLESLSQTLREILAEHPEAEGFQIFIIDHTAHVIAHPNPKNLLVNASDLLPGLYKRPLAGETGSQVTYSLDGEEHLYTYAPIPSARWAVIISRPTAAAFAQSITFHQITLTAFGAFVVIGALFWLVLARRVITPIEQLAATSQAIGEGLEISPQERARLAALSHRPDQMGHLIASLIRMEASIRARINEQATLLETSKAVVSSLDTQTVLNRILEQVGRLMSVEKIALVALDEDAGLFRARASRGLSQRYAEQLAIQPSEPLSVTMRAIRSGEPIQISDTEQDPTFTALRPRARAEGYRSMLAVPLKTHHTPASALLVYRPDPHEFTPQEVRLLVNFANHATMAIENAALYTRSDTRLKEQTRRIEALIQSMQDGLIMGDLYGRVVYANRRVHDLAGLAAETLQGMELRQVLEHILAHSADRHKAQQDLELLLEQKNQQEKELQVTVAGQKVDLRLQAFDVTDPEGISIGQGLILKDTTADRELDRMKSSLVSTVSHELRTPLAAIKGYATTLLAEDVEWDRASQKEFLQIISGESDRLSELVNNLLDLSRIEAGSLKIEQQECKVDELVARAARRGHLQTTNRFTVEIDPALPVLLADPPRLEAILRNLIENAVKYSGENASIQVRVRHQDGQALFQVQDDGPGIPPGQRNRIFESFYRLDDRLAREAGGAGLGLAISEGFVRAHGGQIWVEPTPTGTCIAFTIPLHNGQMP